MKSLDRFRVDARVASLHARGLVLVAVLALTAFLPGAAEAQSTDNITFEKAFGVLTVASDTSTTLTFTITNANGVPVTNLAFTDPLPGELDIADPSTATTTCGGTVDAPAGGGTISFSGGSVSASSSCQIVVDVTAVGSGEGIENTSSQLMTHLGNVPAASATIDIDSDLSFTKEFEDATLQFGGRTTLVFTIQAAASRTNLSFTDNLPIGLVVANPANASTTCFLGMVTATPGAGSFSFANGTISAESSCTVRVDVEATGTGTQVNRSGNLTTNQTGARGFAVAEVEVTTETLLLQKKFVDDPALPGDTVTLRFTISNLDRADTATDIELTDDLDAALMGLTATDTPLANICGAGSSLTGMSDLTFTGGTLAPEASCTFDVTLQVPGTATAGGYTNTTSDITAVRGGVVVEGGPASDDLIVETPPVLTKVATPYLIEAGDVVTVEFTIRNPAPSEMTAIEFTEPIFGFLPFSTVDRVDGNTAYCNGTGDSQVQNLAPGIQGTVRFFDITLAAGASCTFEIELTTPGSTAPGEYVNTTTQITAMLDGSTVTGEPATDSVVVPAAPVLAKTFLDDPVQAGGMVTLELRLDAAPYLEVETTDIAFTDDLPAGLTVLTSPAAGFCGPGSTVIAVGSSIQVSGASLDAGGGTCTFSFTLQVPPTAAPGDYANNTSEVTATVGGIDVTGPGATDNLQVSGLALSKAFANPAVPGDVTTLTFTLENQSPTVTAQEIAFTDDLTSTGIAGLTATGVVSNGCAGSTVMTGSTISFSDGTLAPLASCSFTVTVIVPADTPIGEYTNTTSTVTADDGAMNPLTAPAASGALTVAPALSITKEFTDDPVEPGDTATLEFSITNENGTQPITGITFTDDLDAALSGLAAVGLPTNDVCGAGSQISGTSTVTLTGGNLAAGATCTFSITVQVPGGTPGGTVAVNTTSEVSGMLSGETVTGEPATDTLRVDSIALSKGFDGPTTAGGTVVLTFTIVNDGGPIGGLSFSDDLDATLSGLVATGLPQSNVCGEGSQVSGTSMIQLTSGNLEAGATCTFDVTLQVPADAAPGTYPNTTSQLFSSGVPVGSPATDDLVIEPAPLFSKEFAPDSVGTGQVSTLTFTIDNSASALPATALDFTDNLPAGVVVANPTNPSVTCTGGVFTANQGSGTIDYTGGTVAAGATCTVQVDVTPTTAGTFDNISGELTSSSGDSGTASDTLVANDPPAFSKAFAPNPIAAGDVSTLTFTIDNSGGTVTVTGLDFTDDLPAGVVVADPASASTTCTGGTVTAVPGSGSIGYTGGAVSSGGTCTVQADVTAASPGMYDNTSGELTSSLGSSGTASDTLVVAATGFSVSKSLTSPVLRGGITTLEITITASGSALTDISLTDDLDAALSGLEAVGLPQSNVCGAGSSLTGTSVITLSGGNLAANASCTFSVPLSVPADAPLGVFTNTTSPATATAGGVGAAAPAASDSAEVVFLELSKAFDPSTAEPGTSVVLTFTLVNPDPVNAATDITFTDDLSAVLPGLEAIDLPKSDVCGIGSELSGTDFLTLTGGSLAPGASCTFEATLYVPPGAGEGTFVNVTSVIEATVDGATVVGDAAGAAEADLVVGARAVPIPTLDWRALLLLLTLLAGAGWTRLRG